MDSFQNYLRNCFIVDYSKNIEKKIDGLIAKWEENAKEDH